MAGARRCRHEEEAIVGQEIGRHDPQVTTIIEPRCRDADIAFDGVVFQNDDELISLSLRQNPSQLKSRAR